MFTQYKKLLATPGGVKFSLAAVIARMPISMISLAILFVVVAETDSYALAGALTTFGALVVAIAAPLWSRAADQYGQSRILKITVPIHMVSLAAFLLLVQYGAAIWSWFLAVGVFESFVAGTGQMVRKRWINVLGNERKIIDTAYSYEALMDEFVFILGPVITTFVATAIAPPAGIIAAMIFMTVGTSAFVLQKKTEPLPHPREIGIKNKLLILQPTVQAIFLPLIFAGAFFASVGIVVVGYTDQYNLKSETGYLLAVWALGSAIAATINGGIKWKISEKVRFILFLLCLFTLSFPMYISAHFFPGNMVALGFALFINGLAIAPLLVAGSAVAERSVSPKQVTEVLAWVVSALNLGGALPGAIAGHIIDTQGAERAFLVPVVCMFFSVITLLAYIPIWRKKLLAI